MSANDHPSWNDRRGMRLANYDYRQAGAYFLTICVRHRNCYLGLVRDDHVRLSVLGDIAREEWERTAAIRPGIVLDAFVVMPNHLHAVVIFAEDEERSTNPGQPANHRKETNIPFGEPEGAPLCAPTDETALRMGIPRASATENTEIKGGMPIVGAHSGAPLSGMAAELRDTPPSTTLHHPPAIAHRPARSLGSLVAGYKVSTTKRINDLCGTPGMPFWQRNYYEHIIRNDADLDRICLYITHNPQQWYEDEHNLDRQR